MFKPQNYIISGSCGAGKTTLIEHLTKTHTVVPEKFREVGREMQYPDEPRFHIHDGNRFQGEVLRRSIEAYHLNGSEATFFDRGLPDGLIVLPYVHGITPLDEWRTMSDELRYNTHVFLLDMLPEEFFVPTRHPIPYCKSREFQERLAELYTDLGYSVIEIPADTIERRAETVLSDVYE